MNWMQNPNVKLGLYVAISIVGVIAADISNDSFSTKTIVLAILSGLLTAKAFATDPNK